MQSGESAAFLSLDGLSDFGFGAMPDDVSQPAKEDGVGGGMTMG